MAKTETDPSGSSGSQFFIVVGANVHLPAEYAYVGNVVAGDDTAQTIAEVPTKAGPGGERGSTPATPVVIESATVSTS
jgi:cyclophilin family peptidyl-prolyl cis-trans isomerase